MILVKCTIVLIVAGLHIPEQFTGELIQHTGDKWMVDFTQALKKYPKEDVTPFVKTVNGNQCLIISGRLPYGN